MVRYLIIALLLSGCTCHHTHFLTQDENAIEWYVGSFDISLEVYNTTIIGFARGISHGNGNAIKVVNVITNDCTDGFYGTYTEDSDYNASDIDGDAPGTNSRNGTSGDVTFTDAANRDYALAVGDTNVIDHGTSAVDSLFTDDIKGTTRSGTWDIGAHEYASESEQPHAYAYPQVIILE